RQGDEQSRGHSQHRENQTPAVLKTCLYHSDRQEDRGKDAPTIISNGLSVTRTSIAAGLSIQCKNALMHRAKRGRADQQYTIGIYFLTLPVLNNIFAMEYQARNMLSAPLEASVLGRFAKLRRE